MPIGFRNSRLALGAVSAAMIAFDVAALRPFVDARFGSIVPIGVAAECDRRIGPESTGYNAVE
jgi:hypothetical protein